MKSTRRFIALILALCIVCTLLSVTAFAEGGVIDAVELVNVVPAELGGTITEPALTVPEGANYEVYHQSWNKFDYETGIFEEITEGVYEQTQYQLFFGLAAKEGYTFTPGDTLLVAGEFGSGEVSCYAEESYATIVVTYNFEPEPEPVYELKLDNVPEQINLGDTAEISISTEEAAPYTVSTSLFKEVDGVRELYDKNTFDRGKYSLDLKITVKRGFVFDETVMDNICINGEYRTNQYVILDGDTLFISYYYDLRETIPTAEIISIPVAEAGKTPDVSGIKIPSDANYTVEAYWQDEEGNLFEDTFENDNYWLCLFIQPKGDYRFNDDVTFIVDGSRVYGFSYSSNGIYYDIDVDLREPVAQVELSGIPEDITLGKKLPAVDVKLPKDAKYEILGQQWYNHLGEEVETAKEKGAYTLSITMEMKDGYVLDEQGYSVKANGELLQGYYWENGWDFWEYDGTEIHVEKTFELREEITTAEVSGAPKIEKGKPVDVSGIKVPKKANYELLNAYVDGLEEGSTPEEGVTYSLVVELYAKEGYRFSEDLAAMLDGGLWDEVSVYNQNAYLRKCYLIPVEKEKRIDKIEVTGFPKLEQGKKVDLSKIAVPEKANYEITSIVLFDAKNGEEVTGKLEKGNQYGLDVYIAPKEGWSFAETVSIFIDGEKEYEAYGYQEYLVVDDYVDLTERVDLIEFTGEITPQVGKTPAEGKIKATEKSHVAEIGSVQWKKWDYDRSVFVDFEGTFEAENVYACEFSFKLEEGYRPTGLATLNGVQMSIVDGSADSNTVRCVFSLVSQQIDTVDLVITPPEIGKPFNNQNIQIGENAHCFVDSKGWEIYESDIEFWSNVFRGESVYDVYLRLLPENGYVFAEDVKVTINGKNADVCVTETTLVLSLTAFFDTITTEEGTTVVRDTKLMELLWDAPEDAAAVTLDVSNMASSSIKVQFSAEDVAILAFYKKGLNVVTDSATISLDLATLNAIKAVSNEDSVITLEVKYIDQAALNGQQLAAIAHKSVAGVISAQLLCDGAPIADFGGGLVTVRIPFAPTEGTDVSHYGLWYLAADGQMSAQDATYADGNWVMTLAHFSEYVVLYAPPASNPNTADSFPIAAVVAVAVLSVLGMAVVVAGKKRSVK